MTGLMPVDYGKQSMSLDKQIREMATERMLDVISKADAALSPICREYGVDMSDIGRLISTHKTKTTEAKVVRDFAEDISAQMLKSIKKEA
jgi:hypothetical protein